MSAFGILCIAIVTAVKKGFKLLPYENVCKPAVWKSVIERRYN